MQTITKEKQVAEPLSADKYPNVYDVLVKEGQGLVAALDAALPRTSDATGEARDSIRFEIKRFGITYNFQLFLVDYYKWLDEGRPPGKFPWDKSKGLGDEGNVILQWIKHKRLVIHPKLGLQAKVSKSKLKQVSDNLSLARKIAGAIGWKIKHHGTKATLFYTNTVPDWTENLKKELSAALKRDVVVIVKSL